MTAETTAPAGGPASPETTRRSATRRLHRSRTNRVFAGVYGGIAEYYGSDPTAPRTDPAPTVNAAQANPGSHRKGRSMNAVVVYESHWGNTAAVARAIAEGLGPKAQVLTTDEASDRVLADADLIVAGAPVIAFGLASDKMEESLADQRTKAPSPPDLSHRSMRAWLDQLPRGHGLSAAFETRIWWSPRGATPAIERGLEGAGYRRLTEAHRFVVKGSYGPLREGELDRARQWGAALADALKVAGSDAEMDRS